MLRNIDITNARPGLCVQRLPDGAGLYLEIRPPTAKNPAGFRVWRYRYEIAGRENVYKIGEYGNGPGQLTLAEARVARAQARALVEQGIHPRAHKRIAVATGIEAAKKTFEATAVEWLTMRKGKIAPHYWKQCEAIVNRNLVPGFGEKLLTEVKSSDVLAVLHTVAHVPVWAKLVRNVCAQIYDYAIMAERCDNDPTRRLTGAIGANGTVIRVKKPKPNAWLYVREIPEWLAAVDGAHEKEKLRKIGLRLLMLTLVRPAELTGALWCEFDMDGVRSPDEDFRGPAWYIPGTRMKMKTAHIVPLSKQAMALLAELRELTGHTPFLFPRLKGANQWTRNAPLAAREPQMFSRFLLNIGYGGRLTAHGLRGTASTYLNSLRDGKARRFDRDWIECQLSHMPRGIAARYDHNSYLPDRANMMQVYADAVLPPPAAAASKPKRKGNVLPMRQAA